MVPAEAEIVTDLFKRFYGGESLRSLTHGLTKAGVPTRSGRPWNTRTTRDILCNCRYAGWAVYRGEIATDDEGNPVRGNWQPLIDADTFYVVQARLSDPARKTNKVGTDRRYLGSSLYLCATCDGPITAVNGGKYFCAGHVIRDHKHVDAFVLDLIAERLGQPDFEKVLALDEESVEPWTDKELRLRARLETADNDYAEGTIDARLLNKTKDRISAELAEIDRHLASRRGTAALGGLITAADPAQAFREASLMAQRAVIDALVTVKLHRQPKGRMRRDHEGRERINPDTLVIEWRR